VVELSGRIHGDFLYEPGFTSVTTPVLDVLGYRRGVCQDFAHLMIACLRSRGLAARYVSGYVRQLSSPADASAGQVTILR
jgi:transglutaminase-like putative cysteine protease